MFNRIFARRIQPLQKRALPHAEEFARIFGSTIILLQVLDPTSFHETQSIIRQLAIRKTEADIYMNGVASRLRKALEMKKLSLILLDLKKEIR